MLLGHKDSGELAVTSLKHWVGRDRCGTGLIM